ncbi:hypothetical protein [Streptomyces sp. NPDC055036]
MAGQPSGDRDFAGGRSVLPGAGDTHHNSACEAPQVILGETDGFRAGERDPGACGDFL